MKKKHMKKARERERSTELAEVHPDAPGFREKVTPKVPDEKMFFFKCTCGGIHFRHAGYVEILLPFLKPGAIREVALTSKSVNVCVSCRRCFVWDGEQMYEVTDRVDLEAWEKAEKELHAATGPGGQC